MSKIPSSGIQYSSIDPIMATSTGVFANDIYIDSEKGVNRRFGTAYTAATALNNLGNTVAYGPSGLSATSYFGKFGVIGSYYWANRDQFYTVHDGKGLEGANWVYIQSLDKQNVARAVNIYPDDNQTATGDDSITKARWRVSSVATFAENATGNYLVVATGGNLIRVDTIKPISTEPGPVGGFTNTDLYIGGGGDGWSGRGDIIDTTNCPTKASHVAFLDQMMIANEMGSGRFQVSAVADETSWPVARMFTAESMPDDLKALDVWKQRLFLFGAQTIEQWISTGDSDVIIKVQTYDIGLGPIASLCKTTDGFYFLDHTFRPVLFNGSSYTVLGESVTKTFQALSYPNQIRGTYISKNDIPFYVISSHPDKKSYAFDIKNKVWYQWGNYNRTTGGYDELLWDTVTHVPDWNKYMATTRLDWKIYNLSDTAYQDNSNTIRSAFETGNIDHGTFQRKITQKLILKVRTGDGSGVLMFQYNTDNKGWSQEKQIDLGAVGVTDFNIPIYIGGMYRSRKYRISFSDNLPFVFAGMDEIVKVIEE